MPGFELPDDGVNISEVEGYRGSYLLELLTQSDETLWLFVHENTSVEGLDLVKLSLDVMQRPRKRPMSRASWGEEAPTSATSSLLKCLAHRPLGVLRPSRKTEPRGDPEEEGYLTISRRIKQSLRISQAVHQTHGPRAENYLALALFAQQASHHADASPSLSQ